MSYWVQQPSEIAPKIDENTKQEVETDTERMKVIRIAKDMMERDLKALKVTIKNLKKELKDPKTDSPRKAKITHELPGMQSKKNKFKEDIVKLTKQLEKMEEARLRTEMSRKKANGQQSKVNDYIVTQPDSARHKYRHYELQHLKTDDETKFWHQRIEDDDDSSIEQLKMLHGLHRHASIEQLKRLHGIHRHGVKHNQTVRVHRSSN